MVLALLLSLAVSAPAGTPLFNPRRHTEDAAHDAHDGPVVQWEGAGGLFHRYAMSYTKCPLAGEPGSWTAMGRRLLNRFIENAHGGSAGFDCGQIVGDLHGGALSAGFGNDCGFKSPTNGQTVLVYTSPNLVDWTMVGDALAKAPGWLRDDSIIFRPAVLRNPKTKKYVLWLNRLPRAEPVTEAYRKAGFAVGSSSSPAGPFEFAASEGDAMPTMAHAGGADFSLLYDGDATGDAYIAYGAWHNYRIDTGWKAKWYPEWAREGHQIALQRLDPESFMGPDGSGDAVTVSPQPHQESPAYFKRGEYHYLVMGDVCCFCRHGSDAKVLISENGPLGPFHEAGQLNPFNEIEGMWGQRKTLMEKDDWFGHDTQASTAKIARRLGPASTALPPPPAGHIRAQNSDVIEVQTLGGGELETVYLWSADLWFSARSGLKGDDHQYWEPLRWENKTVAGMSGTVRGGRYDGARCGGALPAGSRCEVAPVPVPVRDRLWRDCYELALTPGDEAEGCPAPGNGRAAAGSGRGARAAAHGEEL
jgi:hypothetical protein